jgi:photosystem II stability/assembly factor-like uncharacterized protein
MAGSYTICIGAVGGGLNVSPDGGESWNRIRAPLPTECNVRAMTVYPDSSQRIIAGTDAGIYCSNDLGVAWEKLDSPMEDLQIWSVAVDPSDTQTIFAGTRPDAFRSRDGGQSWDKLSLGVADPCPIGIARTTNMIVDPRDNRTVWAGVEVDGVFKSLDGGDNWVHLPDLGSDLFHGDIHGMALRAGSESAIFASTPYGVSSSTDEGESWELHEFPKYNEGDRWSYCRGMIIKTDDPNTMFVGNGDTIPGITGAIQRTTDGGQTWTPVNLPVEPNSVVYWFANNKDLPNVVAAASLYGYVYVSEDGGESWRKLRKEFGEIRSIAVVPN